MRIGRGVIAAGVTIASLGVSFATAGAASAGTPTPTYPTVIGVITGPHTFTLAVGEVVVVGETLHPNAPAYTADVPVVAVTTGKNGVTTVTTGYTFLPLNRINQVTTFTVIPPVP
jgi:type IV secretory pathway VirB2 component (pilin)